MLNDSNAIPKGTDPREAMRELFAQRIWRLMLDRGWNQAELGRRAGLGRDVINSYVNAKSIPTPDSVQRLAQAFGVSTAMLFPGANPEVMEMSGRPADIPPVAMKATGDGMALLQVNMKVPLTLAAQIIAMLPHEEAGAH